MKCLECQQDFESLSSLHRHLKAHALHQPEYYVKHYARRSLLTGELLPYRTYDDYFSRDFASTAEMVKWARTVSRPEAQSYLLERLRERKEEKKLEFAPCDIDLKLSKLPPSTVFEELFGTYRKAFERVGLKERWATDAELIPVPAAKILIDTREQQPLSFSLDMEEQKLDFGDYTFAGSNHTSTFVDRKSPSDFRSTLTSGYDRFVREIERARSFGSFLFVVIEATMKQVQENTYNTSKNASSIALAWRNTKEICNTYPDVCQFLFTGSRANSERVIPILLANGPRLWFADVQHLFDARKL